MIGVNSIPTGVSLEQYYLSKAVCGNCGGIGMLSFYRVESIPVHTVLLMDSREQALCHPRRDLELALCQKCGFIGNVIFDTDAHDYTECYEETQSHSPTFNKFAKNLARRLVRELRLTGKSALEIGCGKGEFLVSLVEEGVNHAIGIDPAYREGRLQSPILNRVEFIKDHYSQKHHHLEADFICCRHTLEHIGRPQDFVQIVRDGLSVHNGTIVFFEVPDVMRVLREGAFWDIYYEHCNYFCPTSIYRLFNENRFKVLRVWKEYDEQYLMLIGIPLEEVSDTQFPEQNNVDEVTALVNRFPELCGDSLSRWRRTLQEAKKHGNRIAIWGGGSKTVSFLTTLKATDEIAIVVDINPHKHGKFLPGSGHKTVAPKVLREVQPDVVIVMNAIYAQEVKSELCRLEIDANVLTLR